MNNPININPTPNETLQRAQRAEKTQTQKHFKETASKAIKKGSPQDSLSIGRSNELIKTLASESDIRPEIIEKYTHVKDTKYPPDAVVTAIANLIGGGISGIVEPEN